MEFRLPILPLYGIRDYLKEKNDITTFFHLHYLVCSSYSIIFTLKHFVNIRTWLYLSRYVDFAFKSARKLNHEI